MRSLGMSLLTQKLDPVTIQNIPKIHLTAQIIRILIINCLVLLYLCYSVIEICCFWDENEV